MSENVIFGIYSLHFLSRSFLRWETRIFWRPWLSEVAHLAANRSRTSLGSTPHGTRCWGRGHNEGEWGGKEARSSAWLGLHFPSKTKQNVCTLATWNASLAEGVRANDSLFKGTLWPFFFHHDHWKLTRCPWKDAISKETRYPVLCLEPISVSCGV